MEIQSPHQEDTDFVLEQFRAPAEVKYPLSPEVIAVLEKFQKLLSV